MAFIGEKKIKKIDGNDVLFEDGSKQYFTDRQLEYVVTDEVLDPTSQRDLLLKNIVPDIMKCFEEHNVKQGEVKNIFEATIMTYNDALNTAIGKAFGTYVKGQHPDYFPEQISMSDINKFRKL